MFGSPSYRHAHRARLALLSTLGLGALVSSARAEQFVITDVAWTHEASTTVDSHYHVKPSAETPKNLKSPIDYSKGTVHVVLDVKTKPAGETPTKFQVCFEGSPEYVCTDQSPTYTKVGQLVWSTPVSKFYQGTNGTTTGIDYTKPINSVALILKDTMNNKPQGDPKYTPTDLHIEVAWLSEGASYLPPAPTDGGVAVGHDAAVSDAGSDSTSSDAAIGSLDPPAPPLPAIDAGSPVTDAAVATARSDAGSVANPSDASLQPTDDRKDDSGCRVGKSAADGSASVGVLSVLLFARYRRRRQQT